MIPLGLTLGLEEVNLRPPSARFPLHAASETFDELARTATIATESVKLVGEENLAEERRRAFLEF